jgi:hypothetical protein
MELILATGIIPEKQLESLMSEAIAILSIVSKARKTMKTTNS